MRVAVLQGGRSLERQVSLRSGARVAGRARAPGPRGRGHRRRAATSSPACARPRRTSPSSPCTGATARTGPSRSSSRSLGIPYTGSGVAACMRSLDKVTAKHLLRDAGRRHPGLRSRSPRRPSRSSAPPTRWGRSRSASAFPIVVKPADQGSALGIRFARTPADVPGGPRRGLLLLGQGPARAPRARARARGVACSATRRCRSSRPSRATRTSTTSARATRSGARAFVCPADLGRRAPPRRRRSRSRCAGCSAAAGFARVDLMLEQATGELFVLEANAVPGPDRDEPGPPGGRGRGAGLRGLRRARARAGPGARGAAGRRALSASRCRPRSPRARPGRGTP